MLARTSHKLWKLLIRCSLEKRCRHLTRRTYKASPLQSVTSISIVWMVGRKSELPDQLCRLKDLSFQETERPQMPTVLSVLKYHPGSLQAKNTAQFLLDKLTVTPFSSILLNQQIIYNRFVC